MKYFLIFFSVAFIILAAFVFKPVPIINEKDSISEVGIVSEVYANKGNDVVFVMKTTKRRFYINRGLERGLELSSLKDKLIGKSVVVKYPEYWTPLDWNNTVRHISKVEFECEVIFNEFRK